MPSSNKLVYTEEELASLLNVNRRTIQRIRKLTGITPSVRYQSRRGRQTIMYLLPEALAIAYVVYAPLGSYVKDLQERIQRVRKTGKLDDPLRPLVKGGNTGTGETY